MSLSAEDFRLIRAKFGLPIETLLSRIQHEMQTSRSDEYYTRVVAGTVYVRADTTIAEEWLGVSDKTARNCLKTAVDAGLLEFAHLTPNSAVKWYTIPAKPAALSGASRYQVDDIRPARAKYMALVVKLTEKQRLTAQEADWLFNFAKATFQKGANYHSKLVLDYLERTSYKTGDLLSEPEYGANPDSVTSTEPDGQSHPDSVTSTEPDSVGSTDTLIRLDLKERDSSEEPNGSSSSPLPASGDAGANGEEKWTSRNATVGLLESMIALVLGQSPPDYTKKPKQTALAWAHPVSEWFQELHRHANHLRTQKGLEPLSINDQRLVVTAVYRLLVLFGDVDSTLTLADARSVLGKIGKQYNGTNRPYVTSFVLKDPEWRPATVQDILSMARFMKAAPDHRPTKLQNDREAMRIGLSGLKTFLDSRAGLSVRAG